MTKISRPATLTVEQRIAMERAVLTKLIEIAQSHGYALSHTDDGKAVHKTTTPEECLEVVFSVDDSTIFFKHPEQPKWHCAFIVLGNEGWGALNDCSEGERWDCVIAEYDGYIDALTESL